MHLLVIGSGFAGSILARIARVQGHDVTLVERDAHPRFALGESSTPLAAIALDRVASRYGLEDLHQLAAYGRWMAHMPEVRRGLKRGFTFYRHQRGTRFRNDADNANRLLVAASPDDAVADTHWFREDVDHFLVRRAEAEGVCYLDRTELDEVEQRGGGFRLAGTRAGARFHVSADFIVDASGPDGFLARHLGIAAAMPSDALHTGLIYGHFAGVRPLRRVAGDEAIFPDGPYPDERAAVHHLIDEGWMYELAFDHGVVSAGFVVEGRARVQSMTALRPAEAFHELLRRYPSIAAQYESAQPVRPVAAIPRLQRRLERAAGDGWALLPHAYMFWSPLFSTGIAWSLLGVERLGLILERTSRMGDRDRLAAGLCRYAATLRAEGDYLRRLIETAYRCRLDFESFDVFAQVYFAAASYCEAVQRLCPAPAEADREWAWFGFLGTSDPVLCQIVARAIRIVHDRPQEPLIDAIREAIAPRNVAGLADRARARLYPVDVEALVAASALIGLTADQTRALLPRLRGGPAVES